MSVGGDGHQVEGVLGVATVVIGAFTMFMKHQLNRVLGAVDRVAPMDDRLTKLEMRRAEDVAFVEKQRAEDLKAWKERRTEDIVHMERMVTTLTANFLEMEKRDREHLQQMVDGIQSRAAEDKERFARGLDKIEARNEHTSAEMHTRLTELSHHWERTSADIYSKIGDMQQRQARLEGRS